MDNNTPKGKLAIRTLAMPMNTNPDGHIFGGWVVSQMDLAGLSVVQSYVSCRCVTVAIDSMVFISPVNVGDFVCCYADLKKLGRTSIHVNIETWAVGTTETSEPRKVTEGTFVYVSVDKNGKPLLLKQHQNKT